MDIEMKKLEESNIGWKITFEVKLANEESENCDMGPLEYVGDYEIRKNDDIIIFRCDFNAKELRNNETIDGRLKLINEDIKSMVNMCLE